MASNRLLKFFKVDQVLDSVSAYVEARFELFKVETREEIATAIAKFLKAGILILLLAFSFFLFTVSACIALGELVGSIPIGFLIGGGFYLVLAVIIYLLKDRIRLDERINLYLGSKLNDKENE